MDPNGTSTQSWLFGGNEIPEANALFNVALYPDPIISDLFGEERYFSNVASFWTLQNEAIANLKEEYKADGWSNVIVLETGHHWSQWHYVKATKDEGGWVYISCTNDGEVSVHECLIDEKEAKRRTKSIGPQPEKPARPELTKTMQTIWPCKDMPPSDWNYYSIPQWLCD